MHKEDSRSANIHQSEWDDQSPIGRMVGGKYQVLELLGKGGMSAVYRARQVFLNSDMALKLLDSSKVDANSAQIRRFQQEAKAAHSLTHPSLVKVHDFGLLDTEVPYLVMELVEGETLASYLKRNGPMPLPDISAVFAQACFGLSYAHGEKVVHRDIKPGNIMLVRGQSFATEGSVKIVDFGLAKMLSENEGAQALTRTGEVIGSPIYMSPEQCSGEAIDHRSDIYSLGCVLFEALTGTPPFIAESALRTMMLHQTSPPPTLKEASLGKTFSPALEHIVTKMLAKYPSDRYQDLGIVAHDLAQACQGVIRKAEPKRATPPKPAQPKTAQRKITMTKLQFALLMTSTVLISIVTTAMTVRLSPLKQDAEAVSRQEQTLQNSDRIFLQDSEAIKVYNDAKLNTENMKRTMGDLDAPPPRDSPAHAQSSPHQAK